MSRWAAAALVVAALAGCAATSTPTEPATYSTNPEPGIIGPWQLKVNNSKGRHLFAFLPAGVVYTTEPGAGTWRARAGVTNTYEGTFEIVAEPNSLRVTYIVTVVGDSLAGTGLATQSSAPDTRRIVSVTGTRMMIDSDDLAKVDVLLKDGRAAPTPTGDATT